MAHYTEYYGQDELEHLTPSALVAFEKLHELGAPVKIWHQTNPEYQGYRGYFWLDSEEDATGEWLEYYSNFWGSEKLNKILKDSGLYFEWDNAGYASVYKLG